MNEMRNNGNSSSGQTQERRELFNFRLFCILIKN